MLVFYFSTIANSHGGVQSLILNIARYMSSIGKKVKILDKKDGYIFINANKENLNFEFIDIEDDDVSKNIDRNDTLISFGHFERDLKFFKQKKIRVLYWSVFPDEAINFFKIRTSLNSNSFSNKNIFSKYYTKKFLRLLDNKKALATMELSHVNVIKNFSADFEKINYTIVPVPIFINRNSIRNKRIFEDRFSIAYIGRDEIWKIQPFAKLVEDLLTIDNNAPIFIHLYSNNSKSYMNFLNQKKIDFKEKISIICHEGYDSFQLSNHMLEHVDVLFAMGTSILEGTKNGIPTVILDPSYDSMPNDYKYRWLFEEEGYSLGLPLWLIPNRKGNTLNDVFYDVENKYTELADKCYNYTETNHSIESVMKKLLEAVSKTDLLLEDLNWMGKYFTLKRKIFSLIGKLFKKK